MPEKNQNWENQSQQDWNRNRERYHRDSDFDQDNYNQTGNSSFEQYRNRRMRDQFDEGQYDGGASNYRTYHSNENWEQQPGYRQQSGYGGYRNRNWGNQYGNQYNTGYGNSQNRQENYSQGMYGSEYPSYRPGYNADEYGANAGYLGGQSRGRRNENESRRDYERDWWDRTRDEVSSWFGDEDAERRRRADRQMEGQHRGKGPKGYMRSDQRIQEDVCDRLSDDNFLDATNIEVKVEEGEVILSGTVIDREQKRRAEDLVERISGVRDVENHIKVRREDRES